MVFGWHVCRASNHTLLTDLENPSWCMSPRSYAHIQTVQCDGLVIAEDVDRTKFQLVWDLVLPHEHESVERKDLLRVQLSCSSRRLFVAQASR